VAVAARKLAVRLFSNAVRFEPSGNNPHLSKYATTNSLPRSPCKYASSALLSPSKA
jgi:hypothetical protein